MNAELSAIPSGSRIPKRQRLYTRLLTPAFFALVDLRHWGDGILIFVATRTLYDLRGLGDPREILPPPEKRLRQDDAFKDDDRPSMTRLQGRS
jgi:hypothetical protein